MRPSHSRKPQPPRRGQIRVASMKPRYARDHLRMMTEGAAEVANYGGHEGTGYDSRGAMAPGVAAGADYVTTSVNDTPDSDAGPSGY